MCNLQILAVPLFILGTALADNQVRRYFEFVGLNHGVTFCVLSSHMGLNSDMHATLYI